MEKMKYYLGELHLYDKYLYRNGEFEYETKFIFQTDKDAQTFVDQQARTFYGGVEEDEDGTLWVPNSYTTISSGHPYGIKKDTFDDLKSTGIREAKGQ